MHDYCDVAYSRDSFLKAYEEIIHPVPALSMVEIHEDLKDIVMPPVLKRLPSRPKKNRRREQGEVIGGKRSSTVKCCNCKAFGHNKRTCQRAPVATRKKVSTQTVNVLLT